MLGNGPSEEVIVKLKEEHICQGLDRVNTASQAVVIEVKLLERRETGNL